MIDFSLSSEQAQTQQNSRAFAAGFLNGARASYTALPNGPARFQCTRPILQQATALGLVKGLIPSALGGTGGSLVNSCLAVEELHAVEPSVALTLLANGLGLSPLIMGGSPEQHKEFLAPFLSAEGSPLASLVFSEPGGSANFFELGGKGMQTTASKEGDRWILNGEKVWATNCAGWDFKGADLQVVACRDPSSTFKSPEESAMILLVTRELIEANESDAFTVVKHLETPGHTACSGPHVKFSNLRVPESHVLAAPGSSKALQLIQAAFTSSAVIVGAMSVGVMRAAFDCAFDFAKTHDAGGTVKLMERQSVADLLIDIKMRVEAARVLTWKAAHALDNGTKGGPELAYEAKIWCSEAAVKSCTDAMKVVGISSYSNEYPLATYLADATVLPIFDGGNVGIRRRQIQQLFLAEDYDAWAPAFSATSQE
ncbi:MAG: hypothetical protein LQ342_007923 [Letrouitia transgressa]|nr:MAG: hypothetical protein LQ342_007923 [Letrouitia transgressa]